MTPAPFTPTIPGHTAHSRAEDHASPPADSAASIRPSLSPAISATQSRAQIHPLARTIRAIIHLAAPSPEKGKRQQGPDYNALPGPDRRACHYQRYAKRRAKGSPDPPCTPSAPTPSTWPASAARITLITVKGNPPSLRAQLADLPWRQIPAAHDTREKGHGRAERRTLKITAVAAGLAFPHAAALFLN
jgi:hypothetical protein